MRAGVSLQTRREILQHMLPQYRKACSVKRKSKLLDAFTAATGYNRKYAMGLLRESGNRSSPGWWPIRNGAAATSSGSCSAAPPDGINHYKSAPFSVACGKYEPPCWKPLRSSGKQKSSMDDRPSQFRQQRIPPGVSDRQLSKPPGKIFGEAMHPLGIGVHSVLLRCSCFPVS